jgi:hypothetical protein
VHLDLVGRCRGWRCRWGRKQRLVVCDREARRAEHEGSYRQGEGRSRHETGEAA